MLSNQEVFARCPLLGAPRSSVASGAGLEPGVPRQKHLHKSLEEVFARKTCGVAFFGAFLLLPFGLLSIGAEEMKREPCQGNPALVGPCMPMRGRIGFANGAYWAKIWKVGTQRMLGIHRDIPLPQNLHNALSGRWDVVVFGDFVVCPFTKDIPGHLQSVCVESAAHLRVKKQDDLSRNP